MDASDSFGRPRHGKRGQSQRGTNLRRGANPRADKTVPKESHLRKEQDLEVEGPWGGSWRKSVSARGDNGKEGAAGDESEGALRRGQTPGQDKPEHAHPKDLREQDSRLWVADEGRNLRTENVRVVERLLAGLG